MLPHSLTCVGRRAALEIIVTILLIPATAIGALLGLQMKSGGAGPVGVAYAAAPSGQPATF